MLKSSKTLLRCFTGNLINALIKALPFYLVYQNNYIDFVIERIFRWNNETLLALILFLFFALPLLISLIVRKHLNEFTRELLSTSSELLISANQIILGLLIYSGIVIIKTWPQTITDYLATIFHSISFIAFTALLTIATTFLVWLKNNIIAIQASEEHIQRLKFFMGKMSSSLLKIALNTASKVKKYSLAFYNRLNRR
ncbi:hypothetical protein DesfrDRAFT_0845 [Solidesulfovibrio fructosivorans JJ]]|uniref:Uncharacterized protein n=2 Tax=Solidesulfovibrio fructosivorans TaxID=878 RepID=E1JT96_SOLFR|nr:hypothetical protein DesfrDRAFT_0845 [Solidesulfovibrio fructosivorans JJ]]